MLRSRNEKIKSFSNKLAQSGTLRHSATHFGTVWGDEISNYVQDYFFTLHTLKIS